MTIKPARLLPRDATTGSIEVGEAKVKATLLQGEAVYGPERRFE